MNAKSTSNTPSRKKQAPIEDKQFTYLMEAYKMAIDFFNGYVDRVYNRFNILLGIDIALAGVYAGVWFNSTPPSGNGKILILSLGLIISLLLYIQSAQDKFVIKRMRGRVNEIRRIIEQQIGREDIPALFSPLDDTDLNKKSIIVEGLTSWRSNFISLSRVPVFTALVFFAFWVVAFFIKQ